MLNIYKASAGSGKTFTLTLEYIKLLIGVKDDSGKYKLIENREKAQRHILAITFTNKATEEMKKRIIKDLSLLASFPQESKLLVYLKEIFDTEDVDKIQRASRNALYSILFNFSSFNISTIDSFFQQILRTFAFDIDRNGSFEIELDRRTLISQAIILLFESLDKDSVGIQTPQDIMLRHWLEKFMEDQVEESKRFNIFNRDSSLFSALVEDIDSLMSEEFVLKCSQNNMLEYLDDPNKLKDYEQSLSRLIKKYRDDVASKAADFYNELKSLNLVKLCKFTEKSFTAWINGDISNLQIAVPKAAENHDLVFSSTSTFYDKVPDVPLVLKQQGQDLAKLLVESDKILTVAYLMKENLCLTGLLSIIMKTMREYCREHNIIMLSDTNELIKGIIGGCPTPFIYERMGQKLNNYLIDEFQDTSKMQWENLAPLLIESLSYGHDDLIIGDEKQCIYRFRNAEPELLGYQAANDIKKAHFPVYERGDKLEENTNRRSSDEVIKFNNSLFLAIGKKLTSPNAYEKVIQNIPDRDNEFRGRVYFKFLESNNNNEFMAEATEMAIVEIAKLLKSYRPGEIAILVRKNDEGQQIINALLKAMTPGPNGEAPILPYFKIISNEAVALSSSPAIKLLVNILKLNNRSKESVTSAADDNKKMYSRADSLKLHHRFEINLSENENAGQALVDAVNDSNMSGDTYFLKPVKDSTNDLLSLIDRAILLMPEKMVKENSLFLTMFQDIVKDYLGRNQGDLYSFLKWWDTNGYRFKIDSPKSSDAMTISTIHKSKGLEYKCVIVPYAGKTPKRFDGKLYWVDSCPIKGINDENRPPMVPTTFSKKLLNTHLKDEYEKQLTRREIDTLNTYYVAFTRAEQELIVIAMKKGESEIKLIYDMIKSLNDDRLSKNLQDLPKEMERLVVPLANYFDSDEDVLDFGDIPKSTLIPSSQPDSKEDKKDEKTEQENKPVATLMPDYNVFDNSDKLRLVHVEKDDVDPENIREKGIFMHEVLCGVYTKDDIAFRCRQVGQKADLDPNLIEQRIQDLENAMADERVAPWFENYQRVVMERNFAIEKKEHTRPDRIVWTADGYVDIIDYKFGAERIEYHNQVSDYVNLLVQSGETKVRGFLWFPLDNKIVKITDTTQLTLF